MGPEAKLEAAVKKWADEKGWYCRKFTSPSNRAVPDRLFLKEGRVVFIELKAPGRKPTKAQEMELQWIREHGGEAYWADNLDDVKTILRGYEL